MVNLDSPFARTIIQTFDEQTIQEGVFSNESSEFKKGNEPPYEFEDIPSEVRALCSQFTGDMISWFSVTRSLPSNHLSSACEKRLIVLKQNPIKGSSFKDQLLKHIFDEVIKEPSNKVKQEIVSLSRNYQPVRARVHSILTRLYIRVCFVAYVVLKNKTIQACLGILLGLLITFVLILSWAKSIMIADRFQDELLSYFSGYPKVQNILSYRILHFLSSCLFIPILAINKKDGIIFDFAFNLIRKIQPVVKLTHDSAQKALQTKELQDARTLWMQLV